MCQKSLSNGYISICSNKCSNLYISSHIRCNLEPSMSPETRFTTEVNVRWWCLWSLLCFLNKQNKPSMETKGCWKCTYSVFKVTALNSLRDIHYRTRVWLTITQIQLSTFFIKPYFEFFLQILQFGPISHQLHSGEQVGLGQAFHNS